MIANHGSSSDFVMYLNSYSSVLSSRCFYLVSSIWFVTLFPSSWEALFFYNLILLTKHHNITEPSIT